MLTICSVNGVLFNKSQTELIQCPAGKAGGCTVSNGVTSIGSLAFACCLGLTNIVLPDSVQAVGNAAFEDCFSLASATIGNGVTNLGSSAFYGCDVLTNVTLGNQVASIGDGAFESCSLTSLVIPDSVLNIGNAAFENCPLTNVLVGNGVTRLGDNAFATVYYLPNLAVFCFRGTLRARAQTCSGTKAEQFITARAKPDGAHLLAGFQHACGMLPAS